MNARHSSETAEHYSPAYIVEAARQTLGGVIDLDPASCLAANKTIRATKFYSEKEDGLKQPWNGFVFLNPPGGKTGGESNQKIWWARLADYYRRGVVNAAVFVSFSVELLQTSQVKSTGPTPHDFPICFPSRRIAYTKEDGTKGASPPHASMLVYLGEAPTLFLRSFKDIGRFMGPM